MDMWLGLGVKEIVQNAVEIMSFKIVRQRLWNALIVVGTMQQRFVVVCM